MSEIDEARDLAHEAFMYLFPRLVPSRADEFIRCIETLARAVVVAESRPQPSAPERPAEKCPYGECDGLGKRPETDPRFKGWSCCRCPAGCAIYARGEDRLGSGSAPRETTTAPDAKADGTQREQSYNDARREPYGGRDAQPAPGAVEVARTSSGGVPDPLPVCSFCRLTRSHAVRGLSGAIICGSCAIDAAGLIFSEYSGERRPDEASFDVFAEERPSPAEPSIEAPAPLTGNDGTGGQQAGCEECDHPSHYEKGEHEACPICHSPPIEEPARISREEATRQSFFATIDDAQQAPARYPADHPEHFERLGDLVESTQREVAERQAGREPSDEELERAEDEAVHALVATGKARGPLLAKTRRRAVANAGRASLAKRIEENDATLGAYLVFLGKLSHRIELSHNYGTVSVEAIRALINELHEDLSAAGTKEANLLEHLRRIEAYERFVEWCEKSMVLGTIGAEKLAELKRELSAGGTKEAK